MPYLSLVELNPLRRGAQTLLSDRQKLHAAVEACLPPTRVGEGRVLWRLEQEGPRARLLVQTPDRPTFDHIVDQAGWRDNESGAARIADLSPLLAQLAEGRQFGFRLVANPLIATKAVSAPSSAQAARIAEGKSVHVPHRTAAHQLDWLLARAWRSEQWGFRILDSDGAPMVRLSARDQLRFARGGSRVTIATATFDGVLQVIDGALLRQCLLHGVGKAKAYGCGLLTLAPGTQR